MVNMMYKQDQGKTVQNSEMEVALPYVTVDTVDTVYIVDTVDTVYILFKLLYTS